MADLAWTREAPTEPGHYWLRWDEALCDGRVTVAWVRRDEHVRGVPILVFYTATAWECEETVQAATDAGAMWCGPIPPAPTPPPS